MIRKHASLWATVFLGTLLWVPFLSHGQTPPPFPSNDPLLGRAHAVLALPGGGCVVAGESRDSLKGNLEFAVRMFDAGGNLLSEQVLRSEFQDAANALAACPDGGFVAAGYSYRKNAFGRHDVWLAKFNLNRESATSGPEIGLEWEKLWGKPFREIGFWVGVEADGYVVAGQTKSLGELGDYYFIKTDLEGNVVWENYYVAHFIDYAYSVAKKGDGYWIAGTVSGFHYPSQADHHHTDADVMLVRTDAKGVELDRKFLSGERNDFCRAMLSVEGEGCYLFGSTQSTGAGNFDLQLSRLDEEMELKWQRTYGGKGLEYGTSMAQGENGELYLCGSTGSGGFGQNGYLLKVDAEGEPIWALEMGMSGSEYADGIAYREGMLFAVGHSRMGMGLDHWFGLAVDAAGRFAWEGNLWDANMQKMEGRQDLPRGTYWQRGKGLNGQRIFGKLIVY